MYVCSCTGVTDRTIRTCIVAGAQSVDAVAERCGAGSRCGGCRPLVADLLADSGVDVTIGAGRSVVAA